MGYSVQLWPSHTNQLFIFFFMFLCFFHITTCLHAQLMCTQEQSSALLEFRRHFSFNKSASWYCDVFGIPSHPKLESWKEGTDCCLWDGIECDINNETAIGQVIGLDLSCSWLQGSIHPNSSSTLFHYFPHLQRLNLAFNDFGKSSISPAFGRFTRLTHLNLSNSRFSGEVPIEVSFLTNLVSLDLSQNVDLRLEKKGFDSLVQNLTRIRELNLAQVNLSSSVVSSTSLLLNLSTSLTSLDLTNCGLHGKFSDRIFQHFLPHLKELKMWLNDALTGYIPKFINSSSPLQYLDLGGTSFSGELPDSIGNLKSLEYFYVDGCQFYGSIPSWLGSLTQIILLHLNSNNFTGPLPSQITTRLPNLRWLWLDNNLIDGTIPSWVFTLPALEYLYLGSNKLTGHIYEFQSTTLSYIDLSHNNIHGTIPSSIFELNNLTSLVLSSNNFSGSIELHMLSNAISLIILDLSNNNLSGVIPQFLVNLSQTLVVLDLSSNRLSGAIPHSLGNFSQNLLVLDLSSNSLSGEIQHSLGNLTQNLAVLDLQKNNFSGTIPDTFGKGNRLKTINLNGNGFEGPVPKSLVNCTELEVLDFGTNKFSDKFPYWLENLPNLHVLILRSNKFHGPITTSNAKFPFPNLRVIDLSNNYFTGLLPKKYFKNFKAMMNVDEANFQLKYIGDNNSYSPYYNASLTMEYKGSTIEMVKIVTIFTAVDLANNKFEGEVPEIIGRLNSIRGLNLSHNRLTGYIPTSLGNLTKLEWLDLSSNKLIGNIPQQLTNLQSLGVLNLSQNQLIGPIPRGNQFDTFSNESYIGNLALCGPPLSNRCNNLMAPQPPPLMFQQEEDSKSLFGLYWEVILPGYGCGLVFGLVTGYLMLSVGKPQWLMRIIESERNKSGKRLRKHAHRYRGRRN